MTPGTGEVRTAAAFDDTGVVAFVEGLVAEERPQLKRTLRRLARGSPPAREGGSRCGAMSIGHRDTPVLTAPAYVREIARSAGVALDEHRAGLWAPSQYASRKGVLFLFAPGRRTPELVVKLTRDGTQNARLENEWRALRWLYAAAPGCRGAAPRAAFFGHHAGIAVLGQTAVAGTPLRRRTTAKPDCPLAHSTLRWLLDLGAATVHPVTDNHLVADGLDDLLARFIALYRVTAGERDRLHGLVAAIAEAPHRVPLVLQHGDPGTWNVLVDDDGRPALLDWEAAERDGMPLWDAFYFMRSFAVTVARASGLTGPLAAVRRQLFGDQPINRMLAGAVDDHCARIGLDRELVEPLFVTCWMHRALKEATRLRPGQLEEGHYANLVRLSLRARANPGLRRLYGDRPPV
jgi:aminoglycoside phosphotransferase